MNRNIVGFIVVTLFMVLFLTGCANTPKQLIVKETNYVILDDKHFEIKPAPKPSLSRQEVKQLSDKDKITWLTSLYIELLGHVEILEGQITGIQKAMTEAQDNLNTKKD